MEQESVSMFGKPRTGWATTGDYETMKMAEKYFFPKDLVDESKIDAEAGDAMIEELLSCTSLEYDDLKACRVYSLWNSKTQGNTISYVSSCHSMYGWGTAWYKGICAW